MSKPETAMEHLGFLLHMLSDLHPGERSVAFNDAMAFYNVANPEAKIERPGLGWTYIQHLSIGEQPALYCEHTKEFYSPFPWFIMKQLEKDFLAEEAASSEQSKS